MFGEEAITIAKEQQAHAAIIVNLAESQMMHVIDSKTERDASGKLTKLHHT